MNIISEQIELMKTLNESLGGNVSNFAKRMLGLRSPEEKKAMVIRYLESGENPHKTRKYNELKAQNPLVAQKYVDFFVLYPNSHPKWDGTKFVEQIETSFLQEEGDDDPKVPTAYKGDVNRMKSLMHQPSNGDSWDKFSIGELLDAMGQDDYRMAANGGSGISQGDYGKVQYRTSDSKKQLFLIFDGAQTARQAFDKLSAALTNPYEFGMRSDIQPNIIYVTFSSMDESKESIPPMLRELVDTENKIKFKKGAGYWDVSKYPYGGDFKRFTGEEVGKLVEGKGKYPDEIKAQLDDGRMIICKEQFITEYSPMLDAGSKEQYMNDSGMNNSLLHEDGDLKKNR